MGVCGFVAADQLHHLSTGEEAHVLIAAAARRVHARHHPMADGPLPVCRHLGEVQEIFDVYLFGTASKMVECQV